MNVLVLGYGNPGRQDDGLGPCIAETVAGWELPGVRADTDFQLNIEYAADIAEVDAVIFADAARTGAEPYLFERVHPAREIAFTTHALDPASLVALCRDVYHREPAAFLLGVRGHEFEFQEGLAPAAKTNLDKALRFLKELLQRPVVEWAASETAGR